MPTTAVSTQNTALSFLIGYESGHIYSMSTSEAPSSFRALNVNDYEKEAQRRIPREVYEYLASGSDDEQTLGENRVAFKRWYLRPRVLKPVSNVSCATHLLGMNLSVPFFASPAGVMALPDCTRQGEIATARACARMNTLFCLSQHSTRSIEQVAETVPSCNLWYQCYLLKDRKLTTQLLQRAKKAGYRGVILTVDSPIFGYREADARNGFNALPFPHRLANYPEESRDTYNSGDHETWDQNSETLFDKEATWSDVEWIKQQVHLPVVVKGIHTAEDAVLAMEAGAAGIFVSNHGGRQLDGVLASIDILPEIAAVVQQRVPILIDGGFRRGTDIMKAIALGASAVGIGKPVFFALGVGGEEAVFSMYQLFKKELETSMTLCGCETIREICLSHVLRHPATTAKL